MSEITAEDIVVTQYRLKKDLEAMEMGATIDVSNSPFYDGMKYAVRLRGMVLSKKAKWEWERLPSNRTDAFYRRCRFDSLDEAIDALNLANKKYKQS